MGFLQLFLQLLLLRETAGLQGGEAYGRQSSHFGNVDLHDKAGFEQEKLALTSAVRKELGHQMPIFIKAKRELARRMRRAPLLPDGNTTTMEYVGQLMNKIWAEVLNDTGADVAFEALHNAAKDSSIAKRVQQVLDEGREQCACVRHTAFAFGWSWGVDFGNSYATWQFPKPWSSLFEKLVKQNPIEEPENDLSIGFGASFDFRMAFSLSGGLSRSLFGFSLDAPIFDVGEATNPFSMTIGVYERMPGWGYTFGGNHDLDGMNQDKNRFYSENVEKFVRWITDTADATRVSDRAEKVSLGGGYAISASWTFGEPSEFIGVNFDICWNFGDATPLMTEEETSRSRGNSLEEHVFGPIGAERNVPDEPVAMPEDVQRWGKFYSPPLLPVPVPFISNLIRLILTPAGKSEKSRKVLGFNECRGGLKHFSVFQTIGYAWAVEMATAPPTQAPTKSPTESPTKSPTESPTESPTKAPTSSPTVALLATPATSESLMRLRRQSNEVNGDEVNSHEVAGPWLQASSASLAVPRRIMQEGPSEQGVALLQARPPSFNSATGAQNTSRLLSLIEMLRQNVYHEVKEQDTKSAFTSMQNKSHILLRGSVDVQKRPRITLGLGGSAAGVIGMRPPRGHTGLAFELRIPKLACIVNNFRANYRGHLGWDDTSDDVGDGWKAISQDAVSNFFEGCRKLTGAQLLFGIQTKQGNWFYFPYTFTNKVVEYGIGWQGFDDSNGEILDYKKNSAGSFYAGHAEDAVGLLGLCFDRGEEKNVLQRFAFTPEYKHTQTWTTGLNKAEVDAASEGGNQHNDGNRHQFDFSLKFDKDASKILGTNDFIINVGFDTNFKGSNKFSKVEVKQDIWLGKAMTCEQQDAIQRDDGNNLDATFAMSHYSHDDEDHDNAQLGRMNTPSELEIVENPRNPEIAPKKNSAPLPLRRETVPLPKKVVVEEERNVDPKLPLSPIKKVDMQRSESQDNVINPLSSESQGSLVRPRSESLPLPLSGKKPNKDTIEPLPPSPLTNEKNKPNEETVPLRLLPETNPLPKNVMVEEVQNVDPKLPLSPIKKVDMQRSESQDNVINPLSSQSRGSLVRSESLPLSQSSKKPNKETIVAVEPLLSSPLTNEKNKPNEETVPIPLAPKTGPLSTEALVENVMDTIEALPESSGNKPFVDPKLAQ